MRKRFRFAVEGLLVAIIAIAGCNDSPQLANVSGMVTLDGKPLEQGTMIFEVQGARVSYASIADGKIVDAYTYEKEDGVSVGEARVAIVSQVEIEGSATPAKQGTPDEPGETEGMAEYRSLIPRKYSSVETSGLTATIEAGKLNALSFELTSDDGGETNRD